MAVSSPARARAIAMARNVIDQITMVVNAVSPTLTKIFHWGMVPLVLFLGARSSEPRTKLLDLILPM